MWNNNKIIDTPIELLIFVLVAMAFFMILFKISNWLEKRTPKDGNKKQVKERVKKELIKKDAKIEDVVSKSINDTKSTVVANQIDSVNSSKVSNLENDEYQKRFEYNDRDSSVYRNSSSNYLYDRFVVAPTEDDNVKQKEQSSAFISEEELGKIRDRNIKIRVNRVEDISDKLDKGKLYDKITQMVSENLEAKEKLLNEFEKLPREMKLLLIENIIQKM